LGFPIKKLGKNGGSMENLGFPRENLCFPINFFGKLGFPIETFGNLGFPIESLGNLGFPQIIWFWVSIENLGFPSEKIGCPRQNLAFPIEIFGNLLFPREKMGNLGFPIKMCGKNWGFHGEFEVSKGTFGVSN
jgi:hypothetical protein